METIRTDELNIVETTVSGIVPVVNFTASSQVAPYLNVLLESGLSKIEILLRNNSSFDALQEAIRYKNALDPSGPSLLVGVGTIISVEQLRTVVDLGADFALSPGIDVSLLEEASKLKIPFIPGVATASEIMMGLRHQYNRFKLFPASVIGGEAAVNALAGPFPQIKFCPTGGVNAANLGSYLRLKSVFAVGGTWLANQQMMDSEDWRGLASLMSEAVQVARA